MKQRLSRETIVRITDIVRSGGGNRWNINHEECPAGEDTRKRLYITITDDNKMVLAHCFNCGGSAGFKNPTSTKRPVPDDTLGPTKPPKDYSGSLYVIDNNLYNGAQPILELRDNSWPLQYFDGDAWQGFVDRKGFGIRYFEDWVIIPRGMEDGIITGYDCRKRTEKKFTRNIHPKYKDQSRLLVYNTSLSDTAVVCEDPISAMKVCLAGYAGVSLCGNSLSSDDAFKISMLYDFIVMWMDNDSVSIKDLANQNAAKLQLYTSRVAINLKDPDPKHFSLEFIRTRVNDLKGMIPDE